MPRVAAAAAAAFRLPERISPAGVRANRPSGRSLCVSGGRHCGGAASASERWRRYPTRLQQRA